VDGGEHWENLFTAFTGIYNASYRITIAPSTPSTLFRVTSLQSFPGYPLMSTGTLHRSSDGGQSWTEIDRAFGGNVISALAVNPTTPTTLYVSLWPTATSQVAPLQRIYKSADAGSTWTLLSPTLAYVGSLAVDPVTPSTVYAASYSGLFKSTDGGDTFNLINSTLGASANVSAMVIDPIHPNRLYAATINGQGVFASRDAGLTWASLNNGLTGASLYVQSIAIDPPGGYLFIGTEAPGVYAYQLASSTCASDSHTLCLNSGRFSVTADFQSTPEGPSTPATAVPLTGDTGYFWFFDPTNIELVAKVLTGCTVNNDYWVFAGGLTDVGVRIKVTDTVTGAAKSYSNAVGTPFQPIQDSSAFPCP
jgi:photosystem II stability/assembly factor-like uncharacterized protein